MATKQAKLEAAAAELEANFERQRELGCELRLSLALQGLCPGVFEHGKAYTHAEGSKWAGYVLVVRDGAGKVKRFPLEKVPICLWPEHLQHSRTGDHHYERKLAQHRAGGAI